MTLIATRKTKVGDVVKHEYMPSTGYCRQKTKVTVAAGMAVGALLKAGVGKLEWAAKADADNVVAVLIDDRVYDLTAADHDLVSFARGPAQVGETFLKFSDGGVADAVDFAKAVVALAKVGIEVVPQV